MLPCIHTLRLQIVAFYTKQDFSQDLSFPHHIYLCYECSFGFLSILEIEAHAVKNICTNIFTSKTLKRGWLRHRLPRLVTYATWISLLRRMVASQQQTFLPIDFDFVVISRCVAANFSILEIFEIKRPLKWWLSRTVFKHSYLYQKSHSFAALTRSITDTSTTRVLTPYTRTFHELFSM